MRLTGVRGAGLTRDRGSATAELAVGMVAVVLVLAVLLVTTAAASARMRLQDAARAGARVAAIGQSDAEVLAVARRVAGGAAEVAIVRDPPWVEVRVSSSVAGSWFTGGAVGLSASATTWAEP
jgi:hypothetical protein